MACGCCGHKYSGGGGRLILNSNVRGSSRGVIKAVKPTQGSGATAPQNQVENPVAGQPGPAKNE